MEKEYDQIIEGLNSDISKSKTKSKDKADDLNNLLNKIEEYFVQYMINLIDGSEDPHNIKIVV